MLPSRQPLYTSCIPECMPSEGAVVQPGTEWLMGTRKEKDNN